MVYAAMSGVDVGEKRDCYRPCTGMEEEGEGEEKGVVSEVHG